MNSDCPAPPEGADTVKTAVALVSPVADAVMVAVLLVVGVNVVLAAPLDGVTGDAGLNEPVTPLTENEMALVAVVTVLPFASRIVAV